MAHCVHCNPVERDVLKSAGAGVVHCASSNFMLKSGVLNLRRMLNEGMKVGLGTDIAGGYSSSMLDAMRQAIVASRVSCMGGGSAPDADSDKSASTADANNQEITYTEVFYLATMGSAEVLGLHNTVGNFEAGKQFDALVVDPRAPQSPFDLNGSESRKEVFEKFLFLGDDRNIVNVFVKGRCVVSRDEEAGKPSWLVA